ncbi:MAG: redoxin domain-containing protein [Saprospiraceae bacterium]|nr:redoxin domain-containing protein [Saprospiraceae bacterium]
MKFLHFLAFFFLMAPHFAMKTNGDPEVQVYFFLLEDCKITKSYIPEIRKIADDYRGTSIDFKAVFSNPSSIPDSVYLFLDSYQLPMDVFFDEDQKLANEFQIRVMPEVVVVHRKLHKIIYQGRIDNLFASLGKKRARATTHELRDCLAALKQGIIPLPKKTEAIGCFLEKQSKN